MSGDYYTAHFIYLCLWGTNFDNLVCFAPFCVVICVVIVSVYIVCSVAFYIYRKSLNLKNDTFKVKINAIAIYNNCVKIHIESIIFCSLVDKHNLEFQRWFLKNCTLDLKN